MSVSGGLPADPVPESGGRKKAPAQQVPVARQRPLMGTATTLLNLQRTVGNRAVNLLLRRYAARRAAPRRPADADEFRDIRFQIDSDGDQRDDLEVVIRATSSVWHPVDPALDDVLGLPAVPTPQTPETFTVLVTPSGYVGTDTLKFDWPNPYAPLFPGVVAVSDGKGPTAILLTPSEGQQLLLIYPPTVTEEGLQYRVEAMGKSVTSTFPMPTGAPPGTPVATAGAVTTMPGYEDSVEVTLGAFGDRFRLSLRTMAPETVDKALFSITAPQESEARGSKPVQVALSGPLSMRVVDSGPVSLGLDLNRDDKPEIQLFDQLENVDRPGGSPARDDSAGGPGQERRHRVRATGPALAADTLFPFTVRGDKVSSDVLAIGGVTALDLPLGPFGDMFRLTIQPTGPDQARLGISSVDPSSQQMGYGTEIALSGPLSVRMIDVGPTSVGLDLNGDGKVEIAIDDNVDYWGADEVLLHNNSERDHDLRVTGPALGASSDLTWGFMVRDGRLFPGRNGHIDADPTDGGRPAANALTAGTLAAQAEEGSIQQQLDAYERRMTDIRFKAAGKGIISQEIFDAWAALSLDLIMLEPQINHQKKVNPLFGRGLPNEGYGLDPGLVSATAAHAEAFTTAFRGPRSNYGEQTAPGGLEDMLLVGPAFDMLSAIPAGAWDRALASYWTLAGLLDQAIINELKDREGADSATATQAEGILAQERALRDVAEHNPQRLLAVLLPDDRLKTEDGYMAQVLLSLYYWKEDGSWHLKNLTNPEKPHEYDPVSATADQTEPPDELWQKLDDQDRFPLGVIRYQTAGGAVGEVQVIHHLTWTEFLTYLGIGLTVIGLALIPGGAPVAAEVALAGSAIAGGLAAGIDLVEHIKEGDLTAGTALLDIAQIVSALAGTSALAAGGRINAVAQAGRTAALARDVYVLMSGVRIAADTITLATFGIETVMQLDAIENAPGSREDKDRAKLRLLAQLAVTGGLAALHVKGLAAPPGPGAALNLLEAGGGVLVAEVAGEESVRALTSLEETVTAAKTARVEDVLGNVEEAARAQARALSEAGQLPHGMTEEVFVERIVASTRNRMATAGEAAARRGGIIAEIMSPQSAIRPALAAGDRLVMQQVLTQHGNWQSLMEALGQAGPEGEQIGKRFLKWREEIVADLEKRFGAKPVSGASSEPVSDVDLSTYGADAGAKLIEAEADMAQRFGAEWSSMFRLNFYTDAGRLIQYEDIMASLTPSERAALQTRITTLSEKFNFAQMLQNAGNDARAVETVTNLAGGRFDLTELRALAALDEGARTARRNDLLREIDGLVGEYGTALGARRIALAEQITDRQIEANFYTTEAYIGPGAGRMTVRKTLVIGPEAYQSALSDLSNVYHILAMANGDVVLAAREYELFKYIKRFTEAAAGAARGEDKVARQLARELKALEGQSELLYRVHRGAHGETAHAYTPPEAMSPSKGGVRITDTAQDVEGTPPVDDAYLRRTVGEFMDTAERALPRLQQQATADPAAWAEPPHTPAGVGGSGLPPRPDLTVPAPAGGQPASDAATEVFNRSTPQRQAVFRRNPDVLERFARLGADDHAFLNGMSDLAFDAFAGLPEAAQARFLAASQHVYTPPGGAQISFRANFEALSPARQAALLTEAEITAMENVAAMDQGYTNEGGQRQEGHGFAEHGAQRSDAELFARAQAKGFPISRYNSFTLQEAQAARFRAILEDPTTPRGDDSPINAQGHKAIAGGRITAAEILADPAHNMEYLKSRVTFKQQPAGQEIGTEYDPDGTTTRPVDHATVVFELDTGGRYQVLTNFPENP